MDQEKKNNTLVIFILILAAGGIFVGYRFNLFTKLIPKKTSPEPGTVFIKYDKFQFPEILKETALPQDQIPADLSSFILPTSTDVKTSTLDFTDTSTGFKVIYKYKSTLKDIFLLLQKNVKDKYDSLEGNIHDSTGLIYVEKAGFIYRINIDGSTSEVVTITIISQKNK